MMKKVLSILLVVIMMFSMSLTAFASTASDDSFCIEDYDQYSIDFSETNPKTRSVTGNTIDDAISYVEQFTNTVTRTIFKKRGNTYDSCYQDQTSSLRVKLYFCPVGTAFDSDYIEIRNVFEGEVTANTLTKDEILRVANTYSNHGGEVIYRVSYHRVTEDWGD